MKPISTIQHREFTINIYSDTIDNPRDIYDHSGRIITFHKKYEIGDKKTEPHEFDNILFRSWLSKNRSKIVCLPIYMMDHSGLTLRTYAHEFSAIDPHHLDWGCIGFIYITKKDAKRLYRWKETERITPYKAEQIKEGLRSEVRELDHYINGRIFAYTVTKDEIEVDACAGYLGYPEDFVIPYVIENIEKGYYDDPD